MITAQPTATTPPAPAGPSFSFVGFSDHTGANNYAPSDVVAPGGGLRSCDPSSLFAFVNFSGLQTSQQFLGTWARNGITLNQKTLTESVSSASTFWQVESPPTLSPGTYTFSISINGSVVTSGAMSLTC